MPNIRKTRTTGLFWNRKRQCGVPSETGESCPYYGSQLVTLADRSLLPACWMHAKAISRGEIALPT